MITHPRIRRPAPFPQFPLRRSSEGRRASHERWRPWWIGLGLAALLGLPMAWFGWSPFRGDRPSRSEWGSFIRKTGPMAISEKSMIDSELLAIKEINQKEGGLLGGRLIESEEADGESDWPTYAHKPSG